MKVKNLIDDGYLAPELDIVEVSPEGVLCHSGVTEDYTFNEIDW